MNDQEAMRQALVCARSVEGRTSPRPPVGAVVLHNGVISGRGATAPPYGPHAEVLALEQAGATARGATLYVTLEPLLKHDTILSNMQLSAQSEENSFGL